MKFAIFRYAFERQAWEEVGEPVEASTAGEAFRLGALHAGEDTCPRLGEYRVFPLEGSAHIGVELSLRDLDSPSNPDSGAR